MTKNKTINKRFTKNKRIIHNPFWNEENKIYSKKLLCQKPISCDEKYFLVT